MCPWDGLDGICCCSPRLKAMNSVKCVWVHLGAVFCQGEVGGARPRWARCVSTLTRDWPAGAHSFSIN